MSQYLFYLSNYYMQRYSQSLVSDNVLIRKSLMDMAQTNRTLLAEMQIIKSLPSASTTKQLHLDDLTGDFSSNWNVIPQYTIYHCWRLIENCPWNILKLKIGCVTFLQPKLQNIQSFKLVSGGLLQLPRNRARNHNCSTVMPL